MLEPVSNRFRTGPEATRKEEGIMVKVTLNPLVKQLRGRMGNVVFRTTPSGGTSMIKLADMSNVKWSKAQKAHRKRFKKAVAYAKAALAKPKVRAVYEKRAAKEHKRPFALAVSDYFKGNDLIAKK